jgi:hypothetical protein
LQPQQQNQRRTSRQAKATAASASAATEFNDDGTEVVVMSSPPAPGKESMCNMRSIRFCLLSLASALIRTDPTLFCLQNADDAVPQILINVASHRTNSSSWISVCSHSRIINLRCILRASSSPSAFPCGLTKAMLPNRTVWSRRLPSGPRNVPGSLRLPCRRLCFRRHSRRTRIHRCRRVTESRLLRTVFR